MTKQQILAASEWQAQLEKLELQVREHKATCGHWALSEVQAKPHRDPQFPNDHFRICEFCGRTLKCLENGRLT